MKTIYTCLVFVCFTQASTIAQNVGIGISNPTNRLEVVASVSAPAVASIFATNNGNTGYAIYGASVASNTRAVVGSSNNGFGVQGYTNNHIGISGFSFDGTALSASSTAGYAIQTSGNLKFAGGNTNPSEGAVLTSNNLGDATWKKSNVAFLATNIVPVAFASGVYRKVEFPQKPYDLLSNFLGYNNGATPATSSMFTAPVDGVYHFSCLLRFDAEAQADFYPYTAQMKLVQNISSNALAVVFEPPYEFGGFNIPIQLELNGNFHLNAGDKIWIEAVQTNNKGASASLNNNDWTARFSGHLVVAD